MHESCFHTCFTIVLQENLQIGKKPLPDEVSYGIELAWRLGGLLREVIAFRKKKVLYYLVIGILKVEMAFHRSNGFEKVKR